MKENKNAKANIMAIAKKETTLEPISFAELSEVFGGGSDKTTTKEEPIKTQPNKGHAGGLVCWC